MYRPVNNRESMDTLMRSAYPHIHVTHGHALPAPALAHPSGDRGPRSPTHFLSCSTTQHITFPSPLPRLRIPKAPQLDHDSQRCWDNVPCKSTPLVRQGPYRPSHPPLPHPTRRRDSGPASSARIPAGLGHETEPRN